MKIVLRSDGTIVIENLSGSKFQIFGIAALLLAMITIGLGSIVGKSNTYDENFHLEYGQRLFNYDLTRRKGIEDSKMPFSALNAFPSVIAKGFGEGTAIRTFLEDLNTARFPTLLFSLLVALAVFFWAKELYGVLSGFLVLTLYVFAPNILAHSRLVTTDIYATGMMVFTLYFFWRFLNKPSWNSALVSALVLGLSQLAKYSMIFLYPILAVIALIFFSPTIISAFQNKNKKQVLKIFERTVIWSCFFGLASVFVINVGFLFFGSFTTLGDYTFRSTLFQGIQESLSFLSSVPVPLPSPYVDGIDFVRYREQSGTGYGNMYLLGELRPDRSFPGYFFFTMLFKIPLAVQFLFLLATISYFLRSSSFSFRKNEQFIVLPTLFFLVYFNYLNNAHIGIRFILPVLPLFFVFIGSLLKEPLGSISFPARILAPVSVVYLIVSVLSYYPHFIPYFNEIVWDRKQAFRVLSDSNIDWNQNRLLLQDYLRDNPEAIFEPANPRSGKLVVSVNALTGVWIYNVPKNEMRRKFQWLRDHFEPAEHIGYSYLVYEVSPDEIQTLVSSRKLHKLG